MKKLLIAIACTFLFACATPRDLPPLLTPGKGKTMYRALFQVKRVYGHWELHQLTGWKPAPKGFKLRNGKFIDGNIIYQAVWK